MARTAAVTKAKASKASALDPLIEKLNSFSADNYWDLGKFLVDKLIPTALKEGMFGDQILKRMADVPGFKFPYHMLKQCQMFYTYYPDVDRKPLAEMFYFELATKLDDSKRRDHYERMAISNKWTISDLQKKIREEELARREDERTKFGFDLKERNIWSFDTPDPRFGKSGYRGRIPGQIAANALFYYTHPAARVVDPMAGSGTIGDVVATIPYFNDRQCKMYDINPSDSRISHANVLQTGIPEPTGTIDYVFLDPPTEFYPQADEADFSPNAAKADTMTKFRTLARESLRVLKSRGRVSIIVEPCTGGFGVIDFPSEVTAMMKELGMSLIGKVYLPRRGESTKPHAHTSAEGLRPMASECRELLTFEKS